MQSKLNRSVVLDDANGAISVLVTSSGQFGHSLVAIEYVHQGKYENVVADLVPLTHASVSGRATQQDLKTGTAGGFQLKARIRILGNGSDNVDIGTKVGKPFKSRTWQRPFAQLDPALEAIGVDASGSHPNPGYDHYANSPYKYQFLGQYTGRSTESYSRAHGLNCGNWVRKVLEVARVTDRAGLLYDIPRFQANPGWMAWVEGFRLGMGSAAL